MIAMGMVQPAVDEVVHVVAVRDGRVSAGRAMYMVRRVAGMAESRGALIRIGGAHLNLVLLDDIAILVVHMTVVKVVDVVAVQDADVAAGGTVLVGMVRVNLLRHDVSFPSSSKIALGSSQACSIALSTRFNTWASATA